ncbi:RCC1 domain-containing protein [Leptospira andrefontaineae]|uniref:Chromosome condensation regulator n=1 Tax=Leptospira andrefontaineae TaxID=2484976 RepID=A0A4R9HD15_9LEPT|nr:chromosome condensation regulator [Leptospira andrefontaineae]TGK44727.1 chromosome condensation regulator [Leptospira andrefontaineae]
MKRLLPLLLLFLWTCSNPSSKSPMALLGGTASTSSPNFEISSPSEGDVLSVYQFDLGITSASSGTYEVFLNETKETQLESETAEFQIASLKPKRGQNTLKVVLTNEEGNVLEKSVSFYFGNKLTAGGSHSGFIIDGSVYTCGRNNKGQLGTGFSEGDTSNPNIVKLTSISGIVSISFNQNNSLAIKDDGKVYTWGANAQGQLGLGNTTELAVGTAGNPAAQTPPTEVPGISDAVMGAFGFNHAVILKSDGTVVAFGQNNVGQLGNADPAITSTTVSSNPVLVVGLTNIIQVIAGSQHSAALDSNGDVYVWGRNQYGNLGNGTTSTSTAISSTPTKVPGLTGIKHIANGRDHILALKSDGTVFAWGLNASGQLGIGNQDSPKNSPLQVNNITNAIRVFAGGTQSFALLSDGSIQGWGENGQGNLGNPDAATKVTEPNLSVVGIAKGSSLGIGALHGFVLLPDHSVYGWGWNFRGSLGRPDLQDSWAAKTPVALTFP